MTGPGAFRARPAATPLPRWDILCHVVDNFGDAGVLWRLARRLAADGCRLVTLRIDAVEALRPLVPGAALGATIEGVRIASWEPVPSEAPSPSDIPSKATDDARPGARPDLFQDTLPDVLITGFDARPSETLRRRMRPGAPLWITVEHLSAEDWVETCHRSPSPKADGCIEHFFYPGFTPRTGGLLLEPGILAARDRDLVERRKGRSAASSRNETSFDHCLLFCYRPSPLRLLVRSLQQAARHDPRPGGDGWIISVPGPVRRDRPPAASPRAAAAAAGQSERAGSRVHIRRSPFVPQAGFDALLRQSRLNFVRGEDSQVRAIWAARPFIWQAWRQDRDTRADKVEAFLARQAEWLAPADQAALALLSRWWNGLDRDQGQVTQATQAAIAAALAAVLTHEDRIEAGLNAWGNALSRHELADELLRFAVAQAGRSL